MRLLSHFVHDLHAYVWSGIGLGRAVVTTVDFNILEIVVTGAGRRRGTLGAHGRQLVLLFMGLVPIIRSPWKWAHHRLLADLVVRDGSNFELQYDWGSINCATSNYFT